MSQQVYLGKLGKIFGPYTDGEIEALQTSGEIKNYSWIWAKGAKEWKPLDPMPPSPVANTKSGKSPGQSLSGSFDAVIHDFRTVVTGKVEFMTETGCEVMVHGGHSPQFPLRGNLVINLLEPDSGKTLNVRAKLLAVAPVKGKGLVYRFTWERQPDFQGMAVG